MKGKHLNVEQRLELLALDRLARDLGMRDRVELTRYAIRRGLVRA